MVDDGRPGRRAPFRPDWPPGPVSPGPWAVAIHAAPSPERERVERYLEAAYARAFDGRIARHYPLLMSLEGRHGEVQAAVGFRFAGREPLFLEQYLDEPVEAAVARKLGAPVGRDRIAEIGNLAAESHGASLCLFLTLAGHLLREGCTHAVATATRQLRRRFRRLGVATHCLTRAEPARLSAGAAAWGGYYARDPEVLAGAIDQSLPRLATATAGPR